jgi:CheY-like chemotaxis protein
MDIHMPKMTGDQAALRIRGTGQHPTSNIPVVAVTADPVWADPERRQAVGLTDYLPKPVDVEALSAICRRFVVPAQSHHPS